MALDSAAVFTARLEAIGIEPECLVKFAEKGWNTMGDFAFSSSYTPGQADDTLHHESHHPDLRRS